MPCSWSSERIALRRRRNERQRYCAGNTTTPSFIGNIAAAPDIMEAEYQLKAADANSAARAAFSRPSPDQRAFNGQHGIIWPLHVRQRHVEFYSQNRHSHFNAGRNKANLKLAEIRQQQSVVNYEQKFSPPLNRSPTRSRCGTASASNLLRNSGILIR